MDDRTDPQRTRVLLVSSFVLPHAGGVEQFVETARGILLDRGCGVRVLACRLPGDDATADDTVPTRFLGRSSWPLPVGGWRTLWREVQQADVVVGNNSRHVLPVLAVLVARLQRRGAIFVVHGSGEGPQTGSPGFRVARAAFQRTLARRAVRASRPVSVSRAGVASILRLYGVEAGYLPYPLRVLPPVAATPRLTADEPVRVVWVGRLYPEKDPGLAVRAVERLRDERLATLDVYGRGILDAELARLARSRPWLTLYGPRGWDEIQEVQASAHLCLSTSAADNVQVAVLEALSRGIPVVSTRVGDAPRYYLTGPLSRFCVAAGDADAIARAILELCSSYPSLRGDFGRNGRQLTAQHAEAPSVLARLIDESALRASKA
jgi:glycosyltransferase involved in cell wall biosynthesis